jgi:imidazolonepropionase-like amidohydrolase
MKTFLSFLLLHLGFAACCQTVIQNVNLIDVNKGFVLPGYTIVMKGDLIDQVGPAKKIKAPAGATIIDGSAKYLMPGLIDTHIHFFQSGGLYTRPDGLDLGFRFPYEKERAIGFKNATDYMHRYLRLGITTVMDVGGPLSNFQVRDSIAKTTIAPNVYVTGPLFSMVDRKKLALNDPPIIKITSKEAVDSLLKKMLPLKPDFIKIWYVVTPNLPAEKTFPLVQYVATVAHQNKLKLAVHATELKTAQLAVDAGADILVHSVDDEVLPAEFLKTLKTRNVAYNPTMIVSGNYPKVFAGKIDIHKQDLAWANAFAYGSLTDPERMTEAEMPLRMKQLRKNGIPKTLSTHDSITSINLRKAVEAGITVMTGTDAGNIGTMHASSYLQEMEAMKQAGLTNAQVLKASTIDAAKGFGLDSKLGSIEKNKYADMLLLSKNPLDSIQNVSTIEFVIKKGTWLKADTLVKESPEAVVQRQLNAYNARDIDAFLDTYAEDVEICNFPNQPLMKGKVEMRNGYANFFKNTPNLYCDIVNRIVMGNKIIDQEKVRAGNQTFRAAAIYEVVDGKIKRVTFVR